MSGFIAESSEIGLHEVSPTGLVNYIQNFTNWDLVGARMRGDLPVSVWDVMRYPFEVYDNLSKYFTKNKQTCNLYLLTMIEEINVKRTKLTRRGSYVAE